MNPEPFWDWDWSGTWRDFASSRAGRKPPTHKPRPPKRLRAMRSVNRNR